MSNQAITLTVLSMDNVAVTSQSQIFIVDRMGRITDNMNPSPAVGPGSDYALALPGESQFMYLDVQRHGNEHAHKYTVDETLAEIIELINPTV